VRRHREAVAVLAGEIVAGRRPPGSALPHEVELADRFSFSRGVAREALRALEERGLATVRHGSTTTVNPPADWDLYDPDVLAAALAGPDAVRALGEYLECRRVIETEAAGLAAERATPEQLAALEQRLAELRAAVRTRPARAQEAAYHAAEAAFHAALVQATGNRPLALLVERIDAALRAAGYPPPRPAYRRSRAVPEHEAILAAVRAREPAAARAALTAHLDTVEVALREHARRLQRAA
jgi:GntR family transcriptional repressor for pyruvate dehydrogenase complex